MAEASLEIRIRDVDLKLFQHFPTEFRPQHSFIVLKSSSIESRTIGGFPKNNNMAVGDITVIETKFGEEAIDYKLPSTTI